jgi:transcriptional regulator with GAF, ATPase, and Fis domain
MARRIGRVEQAERGSMCMDELGELPLEMQPQDAPAARQRSGG